MSYILDIVVPRVPANDDAAYDFVDQLRLVYDGGVQPPAPALLAFHGALTQQFPCLSTCDDETALSQCPWSDGPLLSNFSGDMGSIGIASRLTEVLPFILRLASQLGLTVVDQQKDKIHRPPTVRVLLMGAQEGQDVEQLAGRLAPLFKRSQEQTRAMLSGPSLIIKKNLDRATAQRYVDTLSQLGCACSIEQEGGPAATPLAPAAPMAPAIPAAPVASPPSQEDLELQRWIRHNKVPVEPVPGAAPASAPGTASAIVTEHNPFQDEQLADLADGQKQVIYAIALNFLLLGMKNGGIAPLFLLLCGVVVAIQAALGIWRMASGLGLPPAAKVLSAIAMFIPVLGVLVMLFMNRSACGHLKEAGYRVGWLGVSAEERAMLRGFR
ncbi:hypothetical protein AAKU55_001354 [Oxalobacteraceae bacterium GrIS 1.11]